MPRIGVEEKLDGAGVVEPGRAADGEGGVPEVPARRRIGKIRRRRDLDDLLMPALQRAIALEEMDEVAVLVAEELHLDVAGALDELFEEDVGDAERGAGFALGLFDAPRRVALAAWATRMPRPPPPIDALTMTG